jgi:hypothetical protein
MRTDSTETACLSVGSTENRTRIAKYGLGAKSASYQRGFSTEPS